MITTTNTPTRATTFAIDQAHSEVAFDVRHLLTRVRGTFTGFEGKIEFDSDRPQQASASVTIRAASISTHQADRDAHLRSADFFDADRYPTLTFVSRSVTARGGDRYDVAGDLTIRGITRPVVLAARFLGAATDPWQNQKVAFEAETTINRTDFGLTWNAALETGGFLVGDEVRIMLSVQAAATGGR